MKQGATTIRLALFVAAASWLVVGCARPSSPQQVGEATPPPGEVQRPGVDVRLVAVEHRSLLGHLTANGEIVAGADAQASISFPTTGLISGIAVTIGDHVVRGELLASLDARVADSGVAQAHADVATAQAGLEKAQAGARPQELLQNRALLEGARAKLLTNQEELRRKQSLLKEGIASQREVEQAEASSAEALADLRDKEQAGSLLIAGPRREDITLADAQLRQSQAALASARTQLALLTLVAPFDAIVTARMKNPGEVVDSSTPVLTLVNPSKSVVEIQLSEDQAADVHVGDSAMIFVSGAARRVPGHVTMVNAAYNPKTRTLSARIEPSFGELPPGGSASATITVRSVADGVVVPDRALVRDPDSGQVVLFAPLGNGRYRRIAVTVALQSNGYVSLRGSGLRKVTHVVVDGAYELLPFAVGGGD